MKPKQTNADDLKTCEICLSQTLGNHSMCNMMRWLVKQLRSEPGALPIIEDSIKDPTSTPMLKSKPKCRWGNKMGSSFKCDNCKHGVGMNEGKLMHRPGKDNAYAAMECYCGCTTPSHPRWCK